MSGMLNLDEQIQNTKEGSHRLSPAETLRVSG